MNVLKSGKLIVVLTFLSLTSQAQDTLRLSREQAEAVFLKENLLLIAEKLNISQAEAQVLQARLWENPSFIINQVNLWVKDAQNGEQEEIPPLGKIRPNQQFGFEIEQLVQTAGKRKKMVAIEQVSVEKSQQYFEELLRNLKIEFRNQLTTLQYLQFNKDIYQNQLNSIKQLAQAYKKQAEQGHIAQGEYIRLKALELEISKNINELNKDINEAQKELKLFMRLPASTQIEIDAAGYSTNTEQFKKLALNDIIEQAKANRPDYKITQLEEKNFQKLYAYEKAQRVPNITLNAAYDRGGSIFLDFVGVGLAIDIPCFNRNQGNIKQAQIGIEQSQILNEQKALSIENEVMLSYQNLSNAITFFEDIEPDYETTLDNLLASYTKNFTDRNIGMLEYLDFWEAYMENKKIILEAAKDVNEKKEELNYSVGFDIIK